MNHLTEGDSSRISNHHNSTQFTYSDNDQGIILIGPANQYSSYSRQRFTWSRSANLDVVDLTKNESIASGDTSTQIDEDTKLRNMLATNIAIEPFLQKLDCPVCMETFLSILKKGNKLMSTICGHVFCQTCLFASVKASRKCPSCRELLHLNSKSKQYVHRLYLPITLCQVSST